MHSLARLRGRTHIGAGYAEAVPALAVCPIADSDRDLEAGHHDQPATAATRGTARCSAPYRPLRNDSERIA
jgi:hypothetical protein